MHCGWNHKASMFLQNISGISGATYFLTGWVGGTVTSNCKRETKDKEGGKKLVFSYEEQFTSPCQQIRQRSRMGLKSCIQLPVGIVEGKNDIRL